MPTRCALAASGVRSGYRSQRVRAEEVACFVRPMACWVVEQHGFVGGRACGRRNILALSFIGRNQRFVTYNTLQRRKNGRWWVWRMTTMQAQWRTIREIEDNNFS